MQAFSDPFLGWSPVGDRDFYVRQLRDHKGPSARTKNFGFYCVELSIVGATLARAHARSVNPAVLRGYIGKGDRLIDALVRFGRLYADQAEADHKRLVEAIRKGRVPAEFGV